MTNPQIKSNVVSEATGDGLAVYDRQRQRAHVLNATSALVFQHCDGRTTPQQLAEFLRVKFNLVRSHAEQLLWLALGELEKADLLQASVTTTQAPRPILSRRQALKGLAMAGLSLALMPIVSSEITVHAGFVTATTTPAPTTTTTTTPPPLPFTGFFSPVDNPPVYNVAQAGKAIPVKFSLGGDQGMDILAPGYPVSFEIDAVSGAPLNAIEEETTSASGLHYDPDAGQYIYVWKTDKNWAGICRQLVLRLSDTTDHVALFTFQ